MVASEIPNTKPQAASGTPAAVLPIPGVAAVSGVTQTVDASTDFSSVLTQLLGLGAAGAPAPAPAPGDMLNPPIKAADDKHDSDLDAVANDAAAQSALNAIPLVTGIAQAIGTTLTAAAAKGSDRSLARTESGTAANAQMQTTAISNDVHALPEALLKAAAADVQVQVLQPAAANSSNGAASSSENPDKSTSKSAKQDTNEIGTNALAAGGSAVQSATPRAELQIESRVGTPAWRDEIGAKLTWMTEHGVHQGTLHLSPESLGPMEVRITTQNDQVSVWFGAAHADTRAALENALPRLREMFAAQGMSLADSGVFKEPPRDAPRSYGSSRNGAPGISEIEGSSIAIGRRDGIVDAYA
jgi:flagellar hook-length control protein FliK